MTESDSDSPRLRLVPTTGEQVVSPTSAAASLRTPASAAIQLLKQTKTLLFEHLPEATDDWWRSEFLEPFVRAQGCSQGDMYKADLLRELADAEQAQEVDALALLHNFLLVVAYATDAVKVQGRGDVALAWTLLAEAQRWFGICTSSVNAFDEREKERDAVRAMRTRAALASHSGDYARKQKVFDWCASNLHRYPSINKAAEAVIGGEVVNVAFTTARGWISEWKRLKRQAAR